MKISNHFTIANLNYKIDSKLVFSSFQGYWKSQVILLMIPVYLNPMFHFNVSLFSHNIFKKGIFIPSNIISQKE